MRVQLSYSSGLSDWLHQNGASIAVSTYKSGFVQLVGCKEKLSFDALEVPVATGMVWSGKILWLGSQDSVHELRSSSEKLRMHRSYTTGRIRIHDLGLDSEDRLVFVNTLYSCLATLDEEYSFRPIWKPAFISKLVPEDRCHLNGLAMKDGAAAYVTAFSATDEAQGWRSERGGLLIDVQSHEIITDALVMPHSPRVSGDQLFVLDSGRGRLVHVDTASGAINHVVFCPGLLRGLSIHNGYAIIGSSLPRREAFHGLPLQQELEERRRRPISGFFIVDLRAGQIVERLRFTTGVEEVFDVEVLPAVPPAFAGADDLSLPGATDGGTW